ncbi:pentapeptide domain-containing membrane protein [Campylobacter blaseri]|uniref:Pentapeptide repeat-containing protein n=1 Tax=Campylobacter blaseri TaxID=2042961 RepID=A0A2P8QZ56_9BACT|nr:pentapeptide repeat-containing protein [Campylobacter blaseri]PSM51529.1 hypothetical protein CQ405_06950 [Campylobacter blaseri]PSM53322.1 hypothetical protein CRN67_06955 [Campylobacter blaseri]QKF86616.1 pentapeptide domain-containing membrane protein [Campylobacter blaseri]
MDLDINAILKIQENIEQTELEKIKKLGIVSSIAESNDSLKLYSIKKSKYNNQTFFILNGFVFDSKLKSENSMDLEKYLQNDELNIILNQCFYEKNQTTIKNLKELKRKIIICNCKLPDISSCEFENELITCNSDNVSFSGCKFADKVYVEGDVSFNTCEFCEDVISKNADSNMCFASSIFNKSFELSSENDLKNINFEASNFKQKIILDIKKFNVVNFALSTFESYFDLRGKCFNGEEINFTKAIFEQSVSFYRSIFECEIILEQAQFTKDATFSQANFKNILKLNKTKFNDEVKFYKTQFNKIILTEAYCANKANFSNAKFNDKAYFTDTIFKMNANFKSAIFHDDARFLNTEFHGEINFKDTVFNGEANFKTDKNVIFAKEANFSNTTFEKNAYFNNRIFEDFVDFHEANFKKVACFYSVIFKKPVNFSSSIFDGALNFVNAKTDFTYEEFKKFIEHKSINDDQNKEIDECIKVTNDFRDGFRLIKHTLSNKGNALDASLFHRLELYCKELEIEIGFRLENPKVKKNEKDKAVSFINKTQSIPKNKNNLEMFLDLITLKLYRNTSDHHTNLFKIINFTILSIAIYMSSLYIFDNFLLEIMINKPDGLIMLMIPICFAALVIYLMYLVIKYKNLWMIPMLKIFIYAIFSMMIIIKAIDYSIYSIAFILLYLLLYIIFFYLIRFNFICFIICLIFISIFLDNPTLMTPFTGMIISEQMVKSKFESYKTIYDNNSLNNMLWDANFTNVKNENKLNFIIKNRKIILERLDYDKTPLITFIKQPIGSIQKLIDYYTGNKNIQKTEAPKKSYTKALNALKHDEIMQKVQKSSNLLYSFNMLLVFYSLAKTARKNSLIPN